VVIDKEIIITPPNIPEDTYIEMCKFFSKYSHPRIIEEMKKEGEKNEQMAKKSG
jgi:hypothetical protein